jgi:hypothetical protein
MAECCFINDEFKYTAPPSSVKSRKVGEGTRRYIPKHIHRNNHCRQNLKSEDPDLMFCADFTLKLEAGRSSETLIYIYLPNHTTPHSRKENGF